MFHEKHEKHDAIYGVIICGFRRKRVPDPPGTRFERYVALGEMTPKVAYIFHYIIGLVTA